MSEYQGEKAVIYARYSSHSQTEQSIEGQLHDEYNFAEHNGITIVNEYIDRALSGKKDNRPSFQQLMRDAEKREFTLVLVWKLDRFARNRYDAATYRATSQGQRDPDSLRAALSLGGEAPAWECSLGASFPSERALPAGGFGSVHTPSP